MKRKSDNKLDIIFNMIIFVFAILNLFPLYWAITNSFKNAFDVSKVPPQWFPMSPTLENYRELFLNNNALRWTFNSFFISIVTTFLIVVISSFASYAFSKLEFYGKNIIYYIFIATLMIPKEVLLVPLYKIVNTLGLLGTYTGIILPNVATAFGVYLLKQFFDTIPDSIREAAKIDGASELYIFLKIMLPIAKPGIAALFIIMFVNIWNDYLWQLVMINEESMKTLSLGIASLQSDMVTNYAYVMAGVTVAAIPMLLVFMLFQSYFTKGITGGALKE